MNNVLSVFTAVFGVRHSLLNAHCQCGWCETHPGSGRVIWDSSGREDIEETLNFKDKGNADLLGCNTEGMDQVQSPAQLSSCSAVFVISAQRISGFDVSTHCTQATESI